MKQITAVMVGAGDRADVYANVAITNPEKLKIVGIVDPNPVRNKLMQEKYGVCDENCYSSVEEFVKREKFADCVINGTMDQDHVKTSIPVLKKGYDLLLEKPFAVSEQEVKDLCEAADKYGSRVVICHVLRYTEFYKAIKNHILNGDIGDVISIEQCEHVNYHHMAVSYVRGKWRSEKVCFAPMLLAKSCHDIDIMMWMMKPTQPKSVVSFGSDFQFGKARKPEQAGTRCMVDCKMKDRCIFDAEANYLMNPRWEQYAWNYLEGKCEINAENMEKSLKTDNPYGKCVWDFERDGNVDHQNVIINFENGAVGTFTMTGGAAKSERNIHIVGTKGEIKGTFEDSKYVVRKMAPNEATPYTEEFYDLNVIGDKTGEKGAHGGGDVNLMTDFLEYLNGEKPSVSCTLLSDSTTSHLVVFKAEKSRKNGTIERI